VAAVLIYSALTNSGSRSMEIFARIQLPVHRLQGSERDSLTVAGEKS